jgi:hypothetical protein
MKRFLLNILPISALVLSTLTVSVAQDRREAPLTNSSVTKLVRAGFKDKTVIAIIHSRPNVFQLEPDRLIELKRNGVSENIILAMLSQGSPNFSEEAWDDDTFFRTQPKQEGGDSQSGSTDIFGSGAESKSEQRGRGMSGSGSGDTLTTGSATVRIMRPPTEAGGQSLKLEKTPTLNNESIVQLVNAGFSEGTIINRIQNSPADFDLTPNKVEELRKRRVSQAIISAMTAAMDDAGSNTASPGTEN